MIDYSFDRRIADQYARQRAHPPRVSSDIGDALCRTIGAEGSLLEIGIGTGRIGMPAAAAGLRVTGFDVSMEMLEKIELGCGSASEVNLCQADMHDLPFAPGSFDAVLAVHVLHLAKDIDRVIEETVRVLKPGGYFIRGNDWLAPDSVVNQFRNRLRMFVMKARPDMRPPAAMANVDDLLRRHGATETQTQIVTEWTTHGVPADELHAIATRTHSESWVLPDALLEPAVEEIRQWAEATWPDLDEPQPVHRRFELHVTQGSW